MRSRNLSIGWDKQTDADVVITEIGGTIGDIESQPFLEAVRQISLEVGRENSLFIHVTLVPFLQGSDEHKSKPTQHSVKELQGMGSIPTSLSSGATSRWSLLFSRKSPCSAM